MTSLSDVKPASRYLDDLLNIDNPYFEGMVNYLSTLTAVKQS